MTMDATRRLTLAGILSTVFAGPVASEPESGVVTAEGDFVDIDLPIVDVQRAGGGFVGITARGRIEGDSVGLKVDLHPDWRRQPLGGTGAFAYWGKGTCRSIGADSDRFTALLTRLYKLPGSPAPMLDAVEATIVGLANDPARKSVEQTEKRTCQEHSTAKSR